MAKKQTTDQIIAKFHKKHGDKYDYSGVVFQGSHTKVKISCPDHGEFLQTPAIHLRGSECPVCGKIKKGKNRRLKPNDWIEKAKAVHDNRYDYTPTNYTVNRNKVTINCHIHGAFDILPDNHLKGSGCRICALSSERQLNNFDPTDDFKAVHGDRYDYSKFRYVGSNQPEIIICPEHGEFKQSYYVHKKGHGCPDCGTVKASLTGTQTQRQILHRFKMIHGDRYNYSNVEYVHSEMPVDIICKTHGTFSQTPRSHYSGSGCPKCYHALSAQNRTKTTEEFIRQCKETYGDKYQYSKTIYTHGSNTVVVTCQAHGDFTVRAKSHLHSWGTCPKCTNSVSQAETDIGDYLEELGIKVIRSNRQLIAPKEIDIYLPDHRLAIEYCGLYWHGEKRGKDRDYHRDKMLLLAQMNIELVTIFEDEWIDRPEVVKSILRTKLGLTKSARGGRHLTIKTITTSESRDFLNQHHIQGFASGSIHVGAFEEDQLVGVMVFGAPTRQTSSYEWELKRFASDGYTRPGVMGKLYHWFIRKYDPESVVSFSDLRWFSGGSYGMIGFHKDGEIAPDYFYVRRGVRYNKSKFRKSGIARIHPEIYDDSLTEREMMKLAGYDRVWDCGKIRWAWTRLD